MLIAIFFVLVVVALLLLQIRNALVIITRNQVHQMTQQYNTNRGINNPPHIKEH